ncbi:hypothetical protein AVEN_222244-1 [Araneus ventricosus]|uniref:Uncharacterized protein n=1 Tax=Araneus ventricosus TaxID=182803 RepID=A0A4Y2JX84_ARAVE|nr:hypothetical protein AVEN_222244-1 [Araneus ventricosus]
MSACRKFSQENAEQLPRVHSEGFHGFNGEGSEFVRVVGVSALGHGSWPFFPFVPTLGLSLFLSAEFHSLYQKSTGEIEMDARFTKEYNVCEEILKRL